MVELDARRGRHLQQWGLVAAIAVVYGIVRAWAAPEDATVAIRNALDVVALEARFDLFVEGAIQATVLDHAWLVDALNSYYVGMHLPPIVAFLVFVYVRREAAWPFVRDALMLFTVVGLVVHVVYPVAPPWFVDHLGIADTFADAHATNAGSSTLGNRFAAMPSMHFGWALAVGLGIALLARPLWLRVAGALHPVLMGLSIVATGNHYLLDAAASVVLLAACVAAVAWARGWRGLEALAPGTRDDPARDDRWASER